MGLETHASRAPRYVAFLALAPAKESRYVTITVLLYCPHHFPVMTQKTLFLSLVSKLLLL